MSRDQTTLTELARLGFAELSGTSARLAVLDAPDLLPSFANAADPDQALRLLLDLRDSAPTELAAVLSDEDAASRLVLVLGASLGLGEFLSRHPGQLAALAEPLGAPPTAAAYDADLVASVAGLSGEAAWTALRVRYRHHLVRLAAWDLSRPDQVAAIDRVAAALADLAGAALEASLAAARIDAPFPGDEVAATRLAIIGMGKAGARELNYVSDVDVIFVASGSEPVDDEYGEASRPGVPTDRAVEIATRLAMLTMRGIHDLGTEPALWEVDANLRPEGKDGALVRSLESHLAYYERWAKSWEFQALLKARPLAGDRELGERYVAAVAPDGVVERVARGVRGFGAADARAGHRQHPAKRTRGAAQTRSWWPARRRVHDPVAATRARAVRPARAASRDTRRARGTRQTRDTSVGSRRPSSARTTGSFGCSSTGCSSRGCGARISCPPTSPRCGCLRARRAWHPARSTSPSSGSARSSPYAACTSGCSTVRCSRPSPRCLRRATRSRASRPRRGSRRSASATRGVRLHHIAALTGGVSRRATIQRNLLPVMLQWFADGADPDYGLLAFRRLSDDLGEAYWFLRMLRDSSGAAQRLTSVLSGSRFVGALFERIPEAAAWLENEEELQPRSQAMLVEEAQATVARHEGDEDGAALALRTARRREILRLALAAILGLVTVEELGRGLAAVTTAVLSGMLRLVHPYGDGIEFGIVAMGRYGGEELGFGSDADVMYVYRAAGASDEEAQQRAEHIVRSLNRLTEDLRVPLDLDIGLRPEGKNGAIVRSIASYRAYYERWSLTWEAQALLRSRRVVGDVGRARRVREAHRRRAVPRADRRGGHPRDQAHQGPRRE